MDTTTAIAIYGAIVATFVLFWDIIKWRKARFSIDVEVEADRKIVQGDIWSDETYIFITVTNNSEKGITITNAIAFVYESKIKRLLRFKPVLTGFTPTPSFAPQLPHFLKPGAQWSGGIEQDEEFERMRYEKPHYMGVRIAGRRRPILKPLKNEKRSTSG